jgi:hypothetical protein
LFRSSVVEGRDGDLEGYPSSALQDFRFNYPSIKFNDLGV